MKTIMREPAFYAGIDAGIAFAVRVLHAAGIETCQSCEGGAGHAYSQPSIDLPAGARSAAGFAALSVLAAYGLPIDSVALIWNVCDGLPYEQIWRVTFSCAMHDRATDMPTFIHGYEGA